MFSPSRHGASHFPVGLLRPRTTACKTPYQTPTAITTSATNRSSSIILLRYNSSSSAPPTKRTAASARAPTSKPSPPPSSSSSSTLNAPPSTLPPPLTTPTRTPTQSAPSYYFALGRSYLAFYKAGLAATWRNHKTAQALLASKVRPSPTPTPAAAARAGLITRGEWLLLRRSRDDVKRIPLFALLFLVCGEFTPLVVLAVSGVVPRTCRFPRQIESERRKMEKRRADSFRDGTVVADAGKVGLQEKEVGGKRVQVGKWDGLTREQRLHVGRSLALYGRVWDVFGGLPSGLLKRRVMAWKDRVKLDDELIERGGGIGGLNEEELRLACEDRGMDVLGVEEKRLRQQLTAWLKARASAGYVKLLLTRPNMWS